MSLYVCKAQYQYRERYAQGTVKSKQVMICVIGEAGARRTTLVQSLHANYASRKSSVEITAVETSYADKIVVVDFAGQPFFHKMHKQLFSSSSTIFLLVVDLTQSEEEQRRLSHYWLSFVIKCCVRLPEKARIVVYGGRNSYFWVIARELERLVTYLHAEFNQWFDFTLAFSSKSVSINDLSGLRLAHHHLFNVITTDVFSWFMLSFRLGCKERPSYIRNSSADVSSYSAESKICQRITDASSQIWQSRFGGLVQASPNSKFASKRYLGLEEQQHYF